MPASDIGDCPVLSLFSELLEIPSPPGREERIVDYLRTKLIGWGYAPVIDPAGNVMVRLPGRMSDGPTVCLAAHMDEIAVVVTLVEPNGDLRVINSGGLIPPKIGERPVVLLGDQADVPAIVSFGSTHRPGTQGIGTDWHDARLVTGLSVAELAAAGVRPGTPAVPTRDGRGPIVLGNGPDPLVAAWTFDDRAGVAALLNSLREFHEKSLQPALPTMVAFTVHEEGGCHGAKVLAHRERPDVFIAIDGCPVLPDGPLELDGRPGIWSKDQETNYDQALFRDLRRLAKEAGTELQPVVYERAASDAGRVYASGAAPRVGFFGQVRRNSHGFEIARKSVFANVSRVITAFMTQWTG
ncbi:MAG: M20/M25/M40 family metallo-hydrolase [Lentisphaerae bacterium]|jgi:putative aminopeptidase FrvX|nr:M20/M25/M40 family metallo-hydrolase [Lentisphaerota bacterium]MBT4818990.1 M20/M25/M40 family metallo-hydrolase [Lentisphaerota bacterium]MBT5607521.1 M20/M25/M40 family metallo-hydrolase [Lentisphaerota bacterium]MBT7060304.1 M20/M25/M40 family metallo-hydrolase [Lentisphaerota bacterium]MBT7848019.1 M20/M25/M40 family metallo-hydrolase [Lentisphaerota bacterium]